MSNFPISKLIFLIFPKISCVKQLYFEKSNKPLLDNCLMQDSFGAGDSLINDSIQFRLTVIRNPAGKWIQQTFSLPIFGTFVLKIT